MAVDMFLKLDGIDGESTDEQHLKWIELESFSWGVSNTGTLGSTGGSVGRPVPADFEVVMPFSAASPRIFLKAVTGQHITTATVSLRKASGGKAPQDFLKYQFDTVFVTKVDWVGGEEGPEEQMAFAFEKIEIDYQTTNPDGSLGTPVEASFDFLKFTTG